MKIVVVVDMQNDFITGPLGSPEAHAIVPKMVETLEGMQGYDHLILFTKDTHQKDYLETQEGQNLPVEHCIEGTSGWSICKPISSLVDHGKFLLYHGAKDIVKGRFYKPTFGSIRLAEELQHICALPDTDIEEIIFMGVCTDICVVSNVLLAKAYCPEVKITVDASCCAGVTPERHLAALETMKSCQVNVINE
jgi:nicotinamidase-related amidase